MNIKGTAVHSVAEFIKKKYPDRYSDWLQALPAESHKIFKGMILTSGWYTLHDGLTVPLRISAKVFFSGNNEEAARTMGQFSANEALTGVYKFFVKLGSPKFLIERAGNLMSTYFQPSEVRISGIDKNKVTMLITKFPEPDEIIEWNIAGWIERALEVSGCSNVLVDIPKSLALGHPVTEFDITWS